MDIKDLKFGIEIETVGRSRERLARAIQQATGGQVSQAFSNDLWEVRLDDGRVWRVVRDSSLSGFENGEVVSPILAYSDLPVLQEVIRQIRKAGAKVDATCGIHIHVDASAFDGRQLANLAKICYKQEPLILKALGVQERRLERYTKPISQQLIARLEQDRPRTKDELAFAWYGHRGAASQPNRYDNTRYHGVNLHSVFYRGTVEFRWFEATLHAGKVKSYVQLVLALAAKAHNAKSALSEKRTFNPATAKYDFRVFLLRLGFIGEEFKTARFHLLEKMAGDAAFKNGRRQAAA